MSVPGNLYTPTIRKTRGGDYLIEQSLLFDGTSTYLNRTPSVAGNRKTWAWDGWIKPSQFGNRYIFGVQNGTSVTYIQYLSTGAIQVAQYDGSYTWRYDTTALVRDFGAFLHLAVVVDTTAATASDRVKIYINGVRVTEFSSSTAPSLNLDTDVNSVSVHTLGCYWNSGAPNSFFSGVMSLPRLIDGAAPAITDLLTFNDDNTIQPKEYTGDYNVLGSTPTVVSTSSIWTGNTATWTITDDDISGASGTDASIRALDYAFSDDFSIEWTHRTGASISYTVGVYPTASDASFNAATYYAGVFYVSGLTTSCSVRLDTSTSMALWGGTTEEQAGITVADLDVIRFERVGTAFSVYKNDVLVRTMTFTSSDQMRIAIGKGGAADLDTVSFNYEIPDGVNGALLDFADTSKLGEDTSGVTNANNPIPQDWGSVVGNCTSGGGLAAAFDGSVNTAANSARVASSATATVGKNWGSDTFTVTKFVVKTPSDDNFGGGSPATVKLQGSNDGSAWDDLYTNASVTNTGVALVLTATSGINTSSAYQYHRVEISNTGSPSNSNIAEVEFYGTISNSFSASGFVTTDQLADSPTDDADLGIGNYATLNPLTKQAHVTLANGNKNITASDVTVAGNSCAATIGNLNTGKWFWFASLSSFGADSGCGVYDNDLDFGSLSPNSGSINNYGAGLDTTTAMRRFAGGTSVSPDVSLGFTADLSNDYQVYALDADNGYFWAGIYDASANTIYWIDWPNNDMTGDPTDGGTTGVSISGDNWTPFAWTTSSASSGINIYFDHADFPGAVPTGYSAIATQNFPEATISNPAEHFNTVLYEGNGSTQSITGVGFQPDFVWIKARETVTSNGNHAIWDAVRGTGQAIRPNTTEAELGYGITSFGSDGFTVPNNTELNENTKDYVAWCWKANGAGSSNTDGSITATVSANPTAGFSIVSYAGTGSNATVGHGLTSAPDMMIVKHRNSGTGWAWTIYHSALSAPATSVIEFNTGAVNTSAGDRWNSTSPTSSVFSIGTNGTTNENTTNYIAYCWHSVEGFSKFGSYTGNGSTDGPFIYTGFRPAFVLAKSSSNSATRWMLIDSVRHPYNDSDASALSPSSTENEADVKPTNAAVDLLSNGFKFRSDTLDWNGSGYTYIYAAFAEAPFQGGSTEITQGRAR